MKQVNASARFSYKAHGLEPMKKVLLQKEVGRISIADILLTLLKMMDPVTARIS
jgi:hypothetical protein